MKGKEILALLLVLLLCTACAPSDTVHCETALHDGAWQETVELSDGALHFAIDGHDLTSTSYMPPIVTQWVWATAETVAEYLNFDPLTLATKDGFPARAAPTTDDFALDSYLVTKDTSYHHSGMKKEYFHPKGDYWGGLGYIISQPIEGTENQFRNLLVRGVQEEGYIKTSVMIEYMEAKPNSMVGEIPVYTSYRHFNPALAKEGRIKELDCFMAHFYISGYHYLVYSEGFEQSEFVATVLAIINHYGAYPSRTEGGNGA